MQLVLLDLGSCNFKVVCVQTRVCIKAPYTVYAGAINVSRLYRVCSFIYGLCMYVYIHGNVYIRGCFRPVPSFSLSDCGPRADRARPSKENHASEIYRICEPMRCMSRSIGSSFRMCIHVTDTVMCEYDALRYNGCVRE